MQVFFENSEFVIRATDLKTATEVGMELRHFHDIYKAKGKDNGVTVALVYGEKYNRIQKSATLFAYCKSATSMATIEVL